MTANQIEVGSTVRAITDLDLALSAGVDIHKWTFGVVKKVTQGGCEGQWFHVHWNTDYGQRPRNCNPSEVELV